MNKIILCEGETDASPQSTNWYENGDDSEIKSIEDHASSVFKPVISTMWNNEWVQNRYTDAYGTEQMIEGLLVVIPTEHEGALETLMLDSIAEDPYDAVIVDKADAFVTDVKTVASRYLDKCFEQLEKI